MTKVWILQSFLEGGGAKYPWKELQRQSLEQTLKIDYPETIPPGYPSNKQLPNPDTIADANKSFLTAA
jgi:hypothetical protein